MARLYETIKNTALYLTRIVGDYFDIPDIERLSGQKEKERKRQEVEERRQNRLKALEQVF